MLHSLRTHGLYDAYCFSGCVTRRSAQGIFGDPHAAVLTLVRRGKKRSAVPAIVLAAHSTTAKYVMSATCHAPADASSCAYRFVGSPVRPVRL